MSLKSAQKEARRKARDAKKERQLKARAERRLPPNATGAPVDVKDAEATEAPNVPPQRVGPFMAIKRMLGHLLGAIKMGNGKKPLSRLEGAKMLEAMVSGLDEQGIAIAAKSMQSDLRLRLLIQTMVKKGLITHDELDAELKAYNEMQAELMRKAQEEAARRASEGDKPADQSAGPLAPPDEPMTAADVTARLEAAIEENKPKSSSIIIP